MGNGETILVVEDEAVVRAAVTGMLELHGYQVRAAANADEALRLVARYGAEIDLVLTDLVLPGRDGRASGDAIRDLVPEIGVLYMSGFADCSAIPDVGRATRSAFIAKPFTSEELAGAVASLLAIERS